MKRTWGLLKKKIATIEKLNNALSMQLPPNSNHIIEINKGRKTMDKRRVRVDKKEKRLVRS